MESTEILENIRVSDASVFSCGDEWVQFSNSVKGVRILVMASSRILIHTWKISMMD